MSAALISFAALFTLLFLGLPIGFAMGLVGVVGFGVLIDWGPAFALVGQIAVTPAITTM